MVWKQQVPNKVGYWLYVDAGGWVQCTEVLARDGNALLLWWPKRYGVMPSLISVRECSKTLKAHCWYGPIPLPPEE